MCLRFSLGWFVQYGSRKKGIISVKRERIIEVHVFDKNMCKKIFFLDNFFSSSRS